MHYKCSPGFFVSAKWTGLYVQNDGKSKNNTQKSEKMSPEIRQIILYNTKKGGGTNEKENNPSNYEAIFISGSGVQSADYF